MFATPWNRYHRLPQTASNALVVVVQKWYSSGPVVPQTITNGNAEAEAFEPVSALTGYNASVYTAKAKV